MLNTLNQSNIKNTTVSTLSIPDLQGLQIGGVYKNYPELCAALKEPIVSGKQKILQLKKWQSYFLYEKQGREFKIISLKAQPTNQPITLQEYFIKIRDTPLQYRKSKFLYYIVPLLIRLLSKNNSKFTVPFNLLTQKLGINRPIPEKTKYPQWIIDTFLNYSYTTIYPIIKKSLISMRDKKIIDYKIIENVYRKDDEGQVHKLSKTELKKYNTVKSSLSDSNPLSSFYSLKTKNFYKKLQSAGFNTTNLYTYSNIEIILLLTEVPLLPESSVSEYEKILHNNIKEAIKQNIIKDYNLNRDKNTFRYDAQYLSTMIKILDQYS